MADRTALQAQDLAGDGQEVAFQQVDAHEEAARRAAALGAARLAEGPSWITLADPAGHPFDLRQRDGTGPQLRLSAVTIDAPDAPALARFYAGLLAMEVTCGGPEGMLVAGGGKSLMFQQVSGYTPPQRPDPAHPQQGHLDVIVDDPGHLKAVAARAEELGATRLAGGASWITLAGPADHPFDLSIP